MPKTRTLDLVVPEDIRTVEQRIEAGSRYVGWGLPGRRTTTLIRSWNPWARYTLSLDDPEFRWTPIPRACVELEATPQGTRVVARVGLPKALVWASRAVFLTTAPLFVVAALSVIGAGVVVPDVRVWLLAMASVLLAAVGLALNVFGLGYIVYATDRHIDPTLAAVMELLGGPMLSTQAVDAEVEVDTRAEAMAR